MGPTWSEISEAPLYDEHLLLGGAFLDEDAWLALPHHYGSLAEERAAFGNGCALCDLSGMTNMLVSGEGADAFVATACANQPLTIGECSFGAVVTGDGSLASIPFVARTGNNEYFICDASARGMTLHPWLSFLVDIEQEGFRPFGSVTVEDASDALVPLLLWGPQATAVLGDYVPTLEHLPEPGQVASVRLDKIGCLIAHAPQVDEPCYLLLVPPAAARVLWRSLLSFVTVSPVGASPLASQMRSTFPWMEAALSAERLEFALQELLAWELARPEGGYVGARALRG